MTTRRRLRGVECGTVAMALAVLVVLPVCAELSAVFEPASPFVGEAVNMTVTWRSREPFARCEALQMDVPLVRDAAWEVYPVEPDVPEKKRIGLPVAGQRVIGANHSTDTVNELTFSYMLVPRQPGVYDDLKVRMTYALMNGKRPASPYPSYFDNHFFHTPDTNAVFERVSVSVPVTGLTVRSLPEQGRNPRYAGVVGPMGIGAAITPAEAKVGDPMLLTVTLDQLPFAGHIRGLPDAVLDDMGPEFKLSREPIRVAGDGTSRAFTYVVRPLRSGVELIPALALQRFDPGSMAFQTVRTQPLSISVLPDGEATVYAPHAVTDTPPPVPLNGIRGNQNESEMMMTTYALFAFMARYAWVFWLLPPLLWLVLRPWLQRLDRCRNDPAYARAIRAARRFHRTYRPDEAAALRGYLADRLNMNAEAVTFKSIAPELAKRQAPRDLIDALREYFADGDAEAYGPGGRRPGKVQATHALVHRMEASLRMLLLLACLLPVVDAHAISASELFTDAMTLRAERPDEARPLFVEAALDFEAEGHHFNAGNSWFFAGRSGRALANYRAAQRLRPFNHTLRESMAFIRAQRADRFTDAGRARSRVAA